MQQTGQRRDVAVAKLAPDGGLFEQIADMAVKIAVLAGGDVAPLRIPAALRTCSRSQRTRVGRAVGGAVAERADQALERRRTAGPRRLESRRRLPDSGRSES